MDLKKYRELRKITRRTAADELGVAEMTVYRWETGRAMPHIDQINTVATWSNDAVQADDFVNAINARGSV